MKKPSSKIREEIARLQDRLKAAETREAERIGRLALKAGLAEIEVEESELQGAFEDLAGRFRRDHGKTAGKKQGDASGHFDASYAKVTAGTPAGGSGEG